MIQLEKCLFDGGASPQDIALVISTAAKRGSPFPITPGEDLLLFESLSKSLI
jgi:hypothetical protein